LQRSSRRPVSTSTPANCLSNEQMQLLPSLAGQPVRPMYPPSRGLRFKSASTRLGPSPQLGIAFSKAYEICRAGTPP